ncbi:isatin hydrolase-like [Gigantopelta aegis]|uniref:isatin hydrolase-like n=1 Tax=Gigantopelta aegis TaxID=1735272 RepID=UPI001B88A300|nr:isatin hydrolase-like [Gigantopelta aegis]
MIQELKLGAVFALRNKLLLLSEMVLWQVYVFPFLVLFDWLTLTECAKAVVDLTHGQDVSTVYWPGNVDFNFTITTREQTQYYWYESNWFGTAEHGGTHLDSPCHFQKGKWRTHQIPPSRLIGPGIVINVTSQAANNADYKLSISDLESWEEMHGRIPEGAIVLMHSDWGVRYPNRSLVFNTNEPEKPSTFHFPGFHEDAASWLVTRRRVSIVGVDTPSVDHGQSIEFLVHQVLGQHNVPDLENVANLRQLPAKGFTVFVGVIKLVGGSGGPARILAVVDDDSEPSRGYVCLGVPALLIAELLFHIVHHNLF